MDDNGGGLVRAVLFDLDGTLVDSFQGIAATIDAVLGQLGYPACDRTRLRGLIGAPLETIFRTVLPAVSWQATGETDVEVALVTRCVEAYLALYPSLGVPNSPAFPGILPLLERCAASGLRLAVVTTKRTVVASQVLDAVGASPLFAAVLGVDAASHPKPHPAPALEAMRRLETRPEETVVVGDTPMDVGMAVAAGCRAVGVGWGYQPPAVLLASGAAMVAETVDALGEALL